MKLVRLEVSREDFCEISVEVPDDFDERKLMHGCYQEAINHAIDELDPWWDKDNFGDTTEVQSLVLVKPEEEESERKKFMFCNISEKLCQLDAAHDADMTAAKIAGAIMAEKKCSFAEAMAILQNEKEKQNAL